MAGPRPSSLVETKEYAGKFLRWEDIVFEVGPNGELEVVITLKNIKGRMDPSNIGDLQSR
jgi:hypothetical protein